MKRTISIGLCALLCSMISAVGQDFEKCIAQFQAEARSISEALKGLDKQSADLSERRRQAKTKAEQDALDAQGRAIHEARHVLYKQMDEAAKRQSRCMGMPVTKEEVQKRESDMKAKLAKQEQDWLAQAKPYLNTPATSATKSQRDSGGSSSASSSQGVGFAAQGLVAMPAIQDPGASPPKPAPTSLPPSGSGRTPQQKAAAVAALNAELDRLPYLLPKKENAPPKSDVLKLAAVRNASARKSFSPEELSMYSRAVVWIPRFDGLSSDARKARELSLIVSSTTNYFNKPQLIIALATAVFSLDPQSTVAANNLASAIVTAGERLHPKPIQAKELGIYRKDAETCFLYALALSMKGDAWTDESLTAVLNLGNLYLDLGKLEEGRSLFQVARKQSPFSWDAAKGMAAYFHAVNKPDKALTILEDEKLDKPQMIMVAKKHAKALEKKNDDVPLDAPEQVYEDRIEAVTSAPIATAADFMSQIDQSTRNQMRYFVENLPPKGSFTAPPIRKLTQYASLRAINGPQGTSAIKDFMEMLQIYSMSSFAASANEELKMLSRLGINMDPGIDFNDVAKNPQKYKDQKRRPKVKVDTRNLMANLEKLRTQAEAAKRDLATGKTASSIELAAEVDPFFAIQKLDPEEYADPMNIIIQKHNFGVLNRKYNLYNGYLYSVNRRTRQAFTEIAENYQRKVMAAEKIRDDELKKLEGSDGSAESLLRKHAVHVRYANACNAAAETAFGSATNVATVAYVQKIKPKAEAFYYDVIRHVGLISDPEVRDRKDADLRRAVYSALVNALQTVGAAHGSFKYHPEWECHCDLQGLQRQREEEEKAKEAEENARIERNKAAKLAFDSGEIPESSPLWKRLDNYGSRVDLFFISWKVTCARTVVKLNLTVPLVPGSPNVFASKEVSEFTGAGKFDQGIKVSVKAGEGVKGYFSVSSSVTTSGEGVVKDYSVTAATGLSVSGKGTTVNVGGQITFGPGGEVRDSDFSAGVKRDFGNEMGASGSASFEASTKRGCTLSGQVEQTIKSAQDFVDQAKTKAVGKDAAKLIPTDFYKKELWSGKYEASAQK